MLLVEEIQHLKHTGRPFVSPSPSLLLVLPPFPNNADLFLARFTAQIPSYNQNPLPPTPPADYTIPTLPPQTSPPPTTSPTSTSLPSSPTSVPLLPLLLLSINPPPTSPDTRLNPSTDLDNDNVLPLPLPSTSPWCPR